jgi:hypothetical protein
MLRQVCAILVTSSVVQDDRYIMALPKRTESSSCQDLYLEPDIGCNCRYKLGLAVGTSLALVVQQ